MSPPIRTGLAGLAGQRDPGDLDTGNRGLPKAALTADQSAQ